jgi:hypothetical protein
MPRPLQGRSRVARRPLEEAVEVGTVAGPRSGAEVLGERHRMLKLARARSGQREWAVADLDATIRGGDSK